MKKLLSIIAVLIAVSGGLFAQNTAANSRILIVYYSLSGITENVAGAIQKITGGDIHKIETVRAYPDNTRKVSEQAKQEIASGNLPAIKTDLPDLSRYDIVLIGGPVWSGNLAAPVITYMQHESGKLNGKTVAPFWTDAGTAGNYEKEFQKQLGAVKAQQSLGLTRPSSMTEQNLTGRITAWLRNIGVR